MQTAKFVVLFLIWSAKTKSSVTVKMLNSYKVVTKQKGVRIMRQYHETEKKEIQKLAKMYREFLDAGKTERECSSNICRIAKEQGFENLEDVIREGKQLKAGDKIYAENMKKSVIMMEIGTDDIEKIQEVMDSGRFQPQQRMAWENFGVAFGTILVNEMEGMEWVTVIDGKEEYPALQFMNSDMLIDPAAIVWNKAKKNLPCDLKAEFKKIKREAEAVLDDIN